MILLGIFILSIIVMYSGAERYTYGGNWPTIVFAVGLIGAITTGIRLFKP